MTQTWSLGSKALYFSIAYIILHHYLYFTTIKIGTVFAAVLFTASTIIYCD